MSEPTQAATVAWSPVWWRRLMTRLGVCRTEGHDWRFDGVTLGGIWIRCARCRALEEFLPGLHEPKGGEAAWQAVLTQGESDV